MTTNFAYQLADIKERGAYQLYGDAGCGSPDGQDSEGALFLKRVRDAVVEAFESVVELESDVDYWQDALNQIADDAPSVYTHTLWTQFVDLAAYQEDVSEYGDYGDDLSKAAAVALYSIAYRLAESLTSELCEAVEGDAEDEQDDDEDDSFDAIALDEIKEAIGAENVITTEPLGTVRTTEYGTFEKVEDDGHGRTWRTTEPTPSDDDEEFFPSDWQWCDNCQDSHGPLT